MAATTLTTDKGRQLKNQIANAEISAFTSIELALLQSAAITGGTDISENTTTSFSEIGTTGGYSRKDISTALTTAIATGVVTETISSQSWSPTGTSFEDFDMIGVVATTGTGTGATEYITAVWATAVAPRQIGAGSTYNTNALETTLADA